MPRQPRDSEWQAIREAILDHLRGRRQCNVLVRKYKREESESDA